MASFGIPFPSGRAFRIRSGLSQKTRNPGLPAKKAIKNGLPPVEAARNSVFHCRLHKQSTTLHVRYGEEQVF
jgi:hypothetical protein